jgi:hypothetical protein
MLITKEQRKNGEAVDLALSINRASNTRGDQDRVTAFMGRTP